MRFHSLYYFLSNLLSTRHVYIYLDCFPSFLHKLVAIVSQYVHGKKSFEILLEIIELCGHFVSCVGLLKPAKGLFVNLVRIIPG